MKLDVEYRIKATDGQTRWIRSIGQAERDADGIPLRLRGIGQDITERKQAEEERDRKSRNRSIRKAGLGTFGG